MNEEECLEEVIITVFPPMPGVGIIEEDPISEEEDACGDSAPTVASSQPVDTTDAVVITLGSKDPMTKIMPLLNAAKARFGESICIRFVKYDSKENIEEAMEWLNSALRGSGGNAVLDVPSFSTLIGASAPLLSIGNKLSFVGIIPNENQFLTRIAAVLRLST